MDKFFDETFFELIVKGIVFSVFFIIALTISYNYSKSKKTDEYEYICVDNVMYIKHGSSFGVKYDPVTLQPETCFSEESDFQR